MADSTAAIAGSSSQTWLRALLWAILLLFALFYLAPLYVMLATSLKSVEEIRAGNLLALPQAPSLDAWFKAWSAACVGVECTGIGRFFFNSVKMAVPAVAISTIIGALNGYVLTKWTFKGANLIFALILFGCFIPFQIVLIPMARTLGLLGIASTTPGLVLVHVVYGICFTTLYFRNFYAAFPTDLVKAAKIDGAGFFTIFWRIIIPLMRPVFLSSFVILSHLAIKSYDLIVALTDGGPGTATWLPAIFMYKMTFTRNEVALGAASAVMMLMTVAAIMVPYLYSELRQAGRSGHG